MNETVSDRDIKEIIEKYKEEIQGESIFFSDNIPERKLASARRSYAKLENDEEALFLIDTSKFGNAWDGAVLSNVKLYARNLEGAHTIHIKDIKTITRVEESDSVWVCINGKRFLYINAHDNFPTRLVIEMLQKITRCPISSTNMSDDDPSKQYALNPYTGSDINELVLSRKELKREEMTAYDWALILLGILGIILINFTDKDSGISIQHPDLDSMTAAELGQHYGALIGLNIGAYFMYCRHPLLGILTWIGGWAYMGYSPVFR